MDVPKIDLKWNFMVFKVNIRKRKTYEMNYLTFCVKVIKRKLYCLKSTEK